MLVQYAAVKQQQQHGPHRSHILQSGRSYRSCRLYRSCRSMTLTDKHVQIMQIVQTLHRSRCTDRQIGLIPSRSNCTDCTDHTDSTQVQAYDNCNQDRSPPAKHLHVIEINQIPPGTQVEMIRNTPVSPGKLL